MFGQFKQNGFGFNNTSTPTFGQIASTDKTDEKNSSSTYFTNTLSKISSTSTTGFGSSSTPLATSLASLGAKYKKLLEVFFYNKAFFLSKPLFGGLSGTTPSSFTDLKTTSSQSKNI